MALPLWGQQEKSQDDNEKIEEAIIRLIAEHTADPESHLGAGESIEQHKTEDVIDHPAESVVTDKVPDGGLDLRWFALDRSIVFSNFGEGTGWDDFATGNGVVEHFVGQAEIRSGNLTGNITAITSSAGAFIRLNWGFDWMWQVTAQINEATDNRITFGFCESEFFAGNFDGAFFRFDDGDMWVGVSDNDGVETTVSITPVATGTDELHTYRIQYNATDDELYFYIDGVLIETMAPPLRKGEVTGVGAFEVESLADANKRLFVMDMMVSVARPNE